MRSVGVLAPLGAVVLLAAGCGASGKDVGSDPAHTLTVVGTSDVYDSNLVQDVIKPGFEAAHPELTLNYVSKGSGAAIEYAEAGTASVLLVHAASLENQFVAGGYSTEPYGRAVFWGDYVLVGPKDDPADVLQGADHDIVGAFEKIAAAGEAGTAEFVSRGGNPGTTVAEHRIWDQTTGTSTCDVSDEDGGYVSPSTTTGACGTTIAYPDWYHATGLPQGPNIVSADACNFGHSSDCYVLTDRGTFAFLEATKAIRDLRIVTRDNAEDAPGGASLLVNSFHAYAVNPDKFGADAGLNPTGATELLDWLTSPQGQRAVGSYLADGGDAPFLPSAAPTITWLRTPGPLRGVLTNPVPGTPPLAGVKLGVTLNGRTVRVSTDADGGFSIPGPWSSPVRVDVPAITQIENDTLDPVFGDLLTATTFHLG